jgi:Calx-beta domain
MKTPFTILMHVGFLAHLNPVAAVSMSWSPSDFPALPTGSEQPDRGSFELRVRREAAMDTALTVESDATDAGSAAPGKDFQAVSGTLVFAAGQTSKTVTVPILDEGLQEFPEKIGLRLFRASDGVTIETVTAIALLVDNEIPPTLDFDAPETFAPSHERYSRAEIGMAACANSLKSGRASGR